MSQLDLALEAEISTRHLSFVETGRSTASRRMLLALADTLGMPMRERNALLAAGGFAPIWPERGLDANELKAAREVIDIVLAGHLPFPAFAVDRRWTILASNRALPGLYEGVDPALLAPPVNAMRLSLHPKGMAPKVLNLEEWRGHVLARLRAQFAATGDEALGELLEELRGYGAERAPADDGGAPLIPFRLASPAGPLSFLTTTLTFDAPLDVTLSELMVECFFPADAETRARVQLMAAAT